MHATNTAANCHLLLLVKMVILVIDDSGRQHSPYKKHLNVSHQKESKHKVFILSCCAFCFCGCPSVRPTAPATLRPAHPTWSKSDRTALKVKPLTNVKVSLSFARHYVTRVYGSTTPLILKLGVGGEGAASSWSRYCSTSWKVVGSIPDGVTGKFFIVLIFRCLRSTGMSTGNICWEVKAAGG